MCTGLCFAVAMVGPDAECLFVPTYYLSYGCRLCTNTYMITQQRWSGEKMPTEESPTHRPATAFRSPTVQTSPLSFTSLTPTSCCHLTVLSSHALICNPLDVPGQDHPNAANVRLTGAGSSKELERHLGHRHQFQRKSGGLVKLLGVLSGKILPPFSRRGIVAIAQSHVVARSTRQHGPGFYNSTSHLRSCTHSPDSSPWTAIRRV